ncbi:uncharacterized protein LOC132719615 [Ruditapes philippinarum]|uniref:uncharacterized protein LOC132719615 n=1 Tax=Ruditapes philippinarum TaxID=129788 RepID=UPI00295C3197|nr:uncharacterized protein LOC132719615 [Ruditapes philippinarum]
MPSLFGTGKKRGGRYREIKQSGSDSDEFSLSDDEKVLFQKSGEIELNLCPETRIKRVEREESRCRFVLVSVSIAVVLISLVVVGVLLSKFGRESKVQVIKPQTSQQETIDKQITIGEDGGWTVTYKEMAGEGSVRLLDVDHDGIDDIIFASAAALRQPFQQSDQAKTYDVLHKVCKAKGEDYPCMGNIIAVSGINGSQLWSLKTRSEVFAMNCEDFDINKDGKKDCVVTGRTGQISAFDPYKGETLWTCEDDEMFEAYWNTYHAAALPDWDNDSVPEVLIAHGGDMTKQPDDHKRAPGRLVVLSGATGKPISKRYLEMPNSKETYMSPVMFTPVEGGATYILIGSGGETVPGDLMGISVRDFCHYILGDDAEVCGPSQGEEYTGLDKDKNGIFVIYRGVEKGVMVPPVVVDYNNDSVKDILMTSFEGINNLYSGKDLSLIWTANFSGMETYGTPAPGYFNDDEYIDFMVTWNFGVWMEYYSVYVYVISGKDGSVLWNLESNFFQMSSSLSIATSLKHHDAFVFKVQGRDSKFKTSKHGLVRTDKKHVQGRQRRHGNEEPDIRQPTPEWRRKKFYSGFNCDDDLSTYKGEVFIVDRDSIQSPYRILEIPTKKHTYDAALTCSSKPPSGHTAPFSHEGNPDNQGNNHPAQDGEWQENSEEIDNVDDHNDDHINNNMDNNNDNIDDINDNMNDNKDDDNDFIDDEMDDDDNDNIDDKMDDDNNDNIDDNAEDDFYDDNKDLSETDNMHDTTGDNVNTEFSTTEKYVDSAHESDEESIDTDTKDMKPGRESGSHRPKREEKKGKKTMCSVEDPDSMSSGIIGDVDGDGNLDYISITSAITMMYDAEYCPQAMSAELTVQKVNLEKGLLGNIFHQVPVKATTSMNNAVVKSQALKEKTFLPMTEQRWTQYFGTSDKNVYK